MSEKEKQKITDMIETAMVFGAARESWENGENTLCSIKVPKGFKIVLDEITKKFLNKDANSQDGLEAFLNDVIGLGVLEKAKRVEKRIKYRYEE